MKIETNSSTVIVSELNPQPWMKGVAKRPRGRCFLHQYCDSKWKVKKGFCCPSCKAQFTLNNLGLPNLSPNVSQLCTAAGRTLYSNRLFVLRGRNGDPSQDGKVDSNFRSFDPPENGLTAILDGFAFQFPHVSNCPFEYFHLVELMSWDYRLPTDVVFGLYARQQRNQTKDAIFNELLKEDRRNDVPTPRRTQRNKSSRKSKRNTPKETIRLRKISFIIQQALKDSARKPPTEQERSSIREALGLTGRYKPSKKKATAAVSKNSQGLNHLVQLWEYDKDAFLDQIRILRLHIINAPPDDVEKLGVLGLGSLSSVVTSAWRLRKADPDAFNAWKVAHEEGVRLFHSDSEKHAAWLEALRSASLETWRKRKADPVLYKRWLDALLDATWRNNNWIVNRSNSWYKVRLVPTVKFKLIVAGWEPRAISLLLALGVHFSSLRVDHRNPEALARDIQDLGILNVPSCSYEFNGTMRNYYTDLIINIKGKRTDDEDRIVWDEEYLSFIDFLNLGECLQTFVNDKESNLRGLRASNGGDDNEDDDSTVEIALFTEVKCMAGSVKRSGIERDIAKWQGVVQGKHPLITFFFGATSLIVAWMNPTSKTVPTATMRVLKSIFWTKNSSETEKDALARVQKYHKTCTVRRNDNPTDHILPDNFFYPAFDHAEWTWEFIDVDEGVQLHTGDFDNHFQTLKTSSLADYRGYAKRGFDGFTTYETTSLGRDDIRQLIAKGGGNGDDDDDDIEFLPDIDDDDHEAYEEAVGTG